MTSKPFLPPLEVILGTSRQFEETRLQGKGPAGRLPITEEMLRSEPSGNLFGLTQNAGIVFMTLTKSSRILMPGYLFWRVILDFENRLSIVHRRAEPGIQWK